MLEPSGLRGTLLAAAMCLPLLGPSLLAGAACPASCKHCCVKHKGRCCDPAPPPPAQPPAPHSGWATWKTALRAVDGMPERGRRFIPPHPVLVYVGTREFMCQGVLDGRARMQT